MAGRIEVAIGVLVGPPETAPPEATPPEANAECVLIARRRAGDLMGGYWEFPGGKIEPGETPQACLRREFVEELGLHVEVGELVIPDDPVDHDYDHGRVRLHCFWCSPAPAPGSRGQETAVDACGLAPPLQPQCLEVDEWRWVAPAALPDYRFLPANGPIIDAILAAMSCDPVD